ncbi:MAG TPA: hypothetical protein VGK73_12860 [Polyangiaceae bacterium]
MTGSAKTLLLSIVIMSIVIPAMAASEKNPAKGLKKALVNMALFDVFYVVAIKYIYPFLL